jgi:VCBS repeat-containing protein
MGTTATWDGQVYHLDILEGNLASDLSVSGNFLLLNPDGFVADMDVDLGMDNVDGPLGHFTLDAAGNFTYTNSDDHNELYYSSSMTFFVQYWVPENYAWRYVIFITIWGVDDPTVFGGAFEGNVTEAGGISNGTAGVATATGAVTVTDVDRVHIPGSLEFLVDPAILPVAAGVAHYGTYEVTAAGQWTYTLDDVNTMVQALGTGDTLTDSFDIVSNDGTHQTITIAIQGSDDVAIQGGRSNDILYGTPDVDTLDGGPRRDTMNGLGGDDTYIVDDKHDQVIEAGEGHDGVISSANFMLGANVEDLMLVGTRHLNGTGNELDNRINGNAAANMIQGGLGADVLTGGQGADKFVYESAADSLATAGGWDIITDFDAGQRDRIDLRGLDADVVRSGNQKFTFIGEAAFSETNATGQLRFDSATHMLYGSTDADTGAEFAIELTGVTSLSVHQLVL